MAATQRVGVLALQGAFREHKRRLEGLGAWVQEVRLPQHLDGLSGVILPGGESTTMVNLLSDNGLDAALSAFHAQGKALFGTCAGAIVLAKTIHGAPPQFGRQASLGVIDISVQRNAFGRQVDSFSTLLDVKGLKEAFPAVFIRAPVIDAVGEGIEVLARHHGEVVLARSGKTLVSSFHPELTPDARLHALFLEMCS